MNILIKSRVINIEIRIDFANIQIIKFTITLVIFSEIAHFPGSYLIICFYNSQ